MDPIVENVEENGIVEKYKPLFTSSYKSLRIIKNRKSNNDYKDNGAMLSQVDKAFVFPFTKNRDEIFNAIYTIFGKSYKRYIKQYYFPKRFIFLKRLIKGPMIRSISQKRTIQEYVKTRLQGFPTLPLDRITTKKDTILDFTDVLKIIMVENETVFKRAVMKEYSPALSAEIITKLLFAGELTQIENVNLFPYTQGLTVLSNTNSAINMKQVGFNRIIIPVRINLEKTMPLQFQFFSGSTPLNNMMRQDPSIMYDVGLIYFLNKIIMGELYDPQKDQRAEIKNQWLNIWKEKNPIFFFYNAKFGFILDIRQLKEVMNWPATRILRKFREILMLMVRFNINDLPEEELDAYMESEIETEDITGPLPDELKAKEKENKILKFFSTIGANIEKSIDIYKETIAKITKIEKNAKDKTPKTPTDKLDYASPTLNKLFDSLKDLKEDETEFLGNHYDKNQVEEPEIDEEDEDETKEINLGSEEEDELDDEIAAMNENEQPATPKEESFNDDIEETEDVEEVPEEEEPEVLNEKEQIAFFNEYKKEITPVLSPKQAIRLRNIKEKYKSIKIGNDSIEDLVNNLNATAIENIPMKQDIIDESFKKVNVLDFERTYVEKTYKKDLVNCLQSFSDENKEIKFYMQDMKITDTSDQFNAKETVEVHFEDNNFIKHKLKFDLPKMDENYRMMINGNTMQMKKQIIFLPVVKTKPDVVWITSQMNKLYMERIDYTTNRSTHILKHLLFNVLNNNENIKIEMGSAKDANQHILTSIEYDSFSDKILEIVLFPNNQKKQVIFSFHQDKLRSLIKKELKEYKFEDGVILPIGFDYATRTVITVSLKDKYASVSEVIIGFLIKSDIVKDLQDIIKTIKIPKRKSYTRLMFMSKKIPTVIFLSYIWGLNKVITTAGIKVDITTKPLRDSSKSVIRFKNAYLYYDYYPLENALLLNGLNYMDTREINIEDMNTEAPYLEWLYQEFGTRNIAKGWSDFKELFLDNITKEILKDMKLPTDLLELMLYCNELLGDNAFEHEADGDISTLYRIRCQEVIVETLYKTIANQMKLLRKAKDPSKVSLSIPQDAVMAKLFKLTSFNSYDVTNPINEIKQRGIVSFKGSTGVNESRAFTEGKRAYGSKFPGIIAMSAPDNYQVGITKQMTANPNILSTRGYLKTYKNDKELTEAGASELISIEEAAYPYAIDRDDPKRISYTSGQSVHGIKSKYAVPNIIRSPVDKIIANVTSDTFAPKAKDDGVIQSIDEKYGKMFVKYDSGEIDCIKIGTTYVTNSSFLLDTKLVANVKPGQKVSKGEVLAYDKDYFQKEGNDLVYKQGPICFLCIHESDTTEEDSSFLSEEFAGKMTTDVTNCKDIILPPNTNLVSYKKIGDHVLNSDPLMVFEYSDDKTNIQIIDLLGDIDEETKMETMQKSPRADEPGEITNIKVYWTCPLEDMTPSLRAFVEDYIKKVKAEIAAEEKVTKKPSKRRLEIEQSVPRGGRVKRYQVPEEGGVIIEYYTTHEQGMSIGDKASNNTSIKSIIMDVIEQENAPYTESGLVLDGQISLLSIQARHVLSITYVGMLSKIMHDYSKEMANFYFE